MKFFYSNNINDDIIELDSIESRHCIKVLRKKEGDIIHIVDGKGNLYKGSILTIGQKDCHIKIKEVINDYGGNDYYIHIGISPIKNHDRLEWFLEKSVEIGIDEISLIKCNRTIRDTIKLERLYRTAVTAMKQTLKAKIPKINNVVNFDDFINNCSNENKFICHLEESERLDLFSFKKKIKKSKNCSIIIGPEGDFTNKEIDEAKNYNFMPVTLGDSRLRTETAGVVACHLMNIINNQ
tara:strand:- start:84 stop:797 length:714 start_codon:yes stop_codon:yes gene_type:complete